MIRDKEFLSELLATGSPSGHEKEAVDVFSDFMTKMVPKASPLLRDAFDNCAYHNQSSLNNTNSILLTAHIDTISMIVSDINEGGFLGFKSHGGIDKKVLPGTRVNVYSLDRTKKYLGAIGKTPIHLEEYEDDDKAIEMEDLYIDLGYTSKKEVLELGINVGSLVIFERGQHIMNWGKDERCILSPDLDDKVGIYVISEVMRNVCEANCTKDVIVSSTSGEEQGLRGAKSLALKVNPRYAIDVDVTFDTNKHCLEVNHNKASEILVGKGPVINFGGDKNNDMNLKLIQVAEKYNIPYQITASRPGGNNTTAIQEHSYNAMTTQVSIPLRNMHTQQEIVSWDDIENCIKLLTEYILA